MGIGDTLSYVGDTLDKYTGARALRGVLGGKGKEALSILPFSDMLGITNPDDVVSGRNLTDRSGLTKRGDKGSFGAGLAADALLDPSNLLGGLGVAKLGKLKLFDGAADAARGTRGLAETVKDFSFAPNRHMAINPLAGQPSAVRRGAIALGPEYPGGLGKIEDAFRGSRKGSLLDSIMSGPHADRIAKELPEGTEFLGSGTEALAAIAPGDHVIRIADAMPAGTTGRIGHQGEIGRARIPEVLQPSRSVRIGDYRVEHLPYVRPLQLPSTLSPELNDWAQSIIKASGSSVPLGVHSFDVARSHDRNFGRAADTWSALENAIFGIQSDLHSGVSRKGLSAWDVGDTNSAITHRGRAIVHDPGAVWQTNPHAYMREGGPQIPAMPGLPMPESSLAEHLRSIGGPESVRKAIEDNIGRRAAGQGIHSDHAASYVSMVDNLQRMLSNKIAAPVAQHSYGVDDILRGLDFSHARDVPAAAFDPATGKSWFAPDAEMFGGQLRRHEGGHRQVNEAVNAGARAVASLPAAWQPGAWIKLAAGGDAGRSSGLGKFGRYVDEVAQHGTENRGLMNQIMGSLSFAANPAAIEPYRKIYGADSSPILNAAMNAVPVAWKNRVPLAIAAMSAKQLAQLQSELQR
jgi:hypothetical protein